MYPMLIPKRNKRYDIGRWWQITKNDQLILQQSIVHGVDSEWISNDKWILRFKKSRVEHRIGWQLLTTVTSATVHQTNDDWVCGIIEQSEWTCIHQRPSVVYEVTNIQFDKNGKYDSQYSYHSQIQHLLCQPTNHQLEFLLYHCWLLQINLVGQGIGKGSGYTN